MVDDVIVVKDEFLGQVLGFGTSVYGKGVVAFDFVYSNRVIGVMVVDV